MLLVAHRPIPVTCVSRSASGTCAIERCSPQSVPFLPRPPPKVALPCSTGSPVLRHSPTSPERSRPRYGLWPLRTGLAATDKTYRRSPGSRACCFSACAGSKTTQDRTATRVSRGCRIAFLLSEWSRHPVPSAFRSSIARPTGTSVYASVHTSRCARKTRGQDGFAFLLSCRALSSPTTCRFIPALSGWPTIHSGCGDVTTAVALPIGREIACDHQVGTPREQETTRSFRQWVPSADQLPVLLRTGPA
jgi:hypothetical protein